MNIYRDGEKIFKICVFFVGLVLIFSFGINASSAVSSNNIYVSTNGNDMWNGLNSTWIGGVNGPKATIKNATNMVEDNGTVYIADGTYNENNITINKNIKINGQNTNQTIINGENTWWIFNIANNVNVTLENLTLTRGYNTGNGGAIINNGNLTITSCTFTNNTSTNFGGAIDNNYANCTVLGSTFTNNSAVIGGAIINYGGSCGVNGSTFLNNTASLGGGAIENYGIICSVTGCTFTNNSAKLGAIDNEAGTCSVTYSTFTNNSSSSTTNGGGAICNGFSNCIVTGCTFIKNTAQNFGGAFYNDKGTFTVTCSTFTNNTAYNGGVFYNDNGAFSLVGSNFTNNNAQYYGGVFYNGNGGCSVVGSTFTYNTVQYYGGAIYNRNSTCIVADCAFINNTALSAGAIYNDYGNCSVVGSNFIKNTASNCGAIYNFGGNCSVTGSTFTNNTAKNGCGGAILNFGPSCSVTGCTFTNNSAAVYGGAIANGGPCNVISSTFTGNVASICGSVVYNDGGTVNITFCRIVGNALNSTLIYSKVGTTNALYDWWGSNSNPAVNVNSNVNATAWMVLRISTNLNTILNGSKSTIKATLYYDNLNTYHNPANGHVPDGIGITFTGTLGNLSPKTTSLSNGVANSTFTATSGGLATIGAKIDNQTVNTKITSTLPIANSNIPSGVYNTTQKIILSMTNASSIYYTTNGQNPTTASTRYTVPLNIPVSTTLKFLAVDLAGNLSPIYTRNYTIDRIPPKITSTTPKQNAKNVSLIAPITIKFSEKIIKGVNFSSIYIKNVITGKITQTTATLSGNIITIKMIKNRLSLNNYQIVVPTGSVKDAAGNNNSKYMLNFKSRY